jgi:hypothetical protein
VSALVAHLADQFAAQLAPVPEARGLDDLSRDEIAALLAAELGRREGGNHS